ncbi:MAG: hypothetical protein KA314_04690 [Chloroflexi bacterium]|nr:hypothetical protein [Chloroflexota bacterium]
MANVTMVVWQVKEVRRRCWRGESLKEIAGDMRLNYGPVYRAARGKTWASIVDPPPVPVGMMHTARKHRARRSRKCGNCGANYRAGGTDTRCGGCYAYRHRHGVEKPGHWNRSTHLKVHHLSEAVLRLLYEQYKAGAPYAVLAEDQPFSAETLRRRFKEAGYVLRDCTGMRRKLTAGLVRQAREMVYNEGKMVSALAQEWGINYQTLHSAVVGATWQLAGGPLPNIIGKGKSCCRCGLLTEHPSGYCQYCR